MQINALRNRLRKVRDKPYRGHAGLTALCPVCQASSPDSSSGHLLVWETDGGRTRLKCTINGCTEEQILNSFGVNRPSRGRPSRGRPEQVWDYVDESGAYVFSKAKWSNPKSFRQGVRQPGGTFIWDLKGVPQNRPLYRLPELSKAISERKLIHLCEGEKAVDRLYQSGHVATCQSDGAGTGKLRDHHVEILARAAEVMIWADRDAPGTAYAHECARKLESRGVTCRIVQSKTSDEHDDAFDHLEAGFGVDDAIPLPAEASATPRQDANVSAWSGFLSVAELLVQSNIEPQWLWEGILPVGGVALFCAKPKVGKSTLLRHLALCVARGDEFLGRATRSGPVLYLAIEETPQIVGAEVRRVGWNEQDRIMLRFGSAPLGNHRDVIEDLKVVVRTQGSRLLIVDTIGRLARVKQGNDYAEVTQALEPLVDLARETGCAVIMTHHLGKNERDTGDGSLGSTAYFAAVDVCIELKRLNGARVLDSVARAGIPFEGQVLAFEPESRRVSLGGNVAELKAKGTEARIIDELSHGNSLTRDELRLAVGGNATRFSDAFRRASEAGSIVKASGTGKRGDPIYYTIPRSGTGMELESN